MNEDYMKRFSEKLDKSIEAVRAARMEDERRRLMSTIGQDLAKMLQPFLSQMAASAKVNKDELRDAMHEAMGVLNARETHIDTAPIIDAIQQAFMAIELPQPKVQVNVPEMKIPDLKMPEKMPIEGFVGMMTNGAQVGWDNPMPVVMYDKNGKPIDLFAGMTQVIAGGGGGKADFFTIKGFSQSAFSELMNPDGRVKVELPTGSSGLTDTELRASAVPVKQVSGETWSVSVNDIFRTTAASTLINGDDRLRVSVETGGSGLTDAELRASRVYVEQVSGANWSVSVTDIFGSVGANIVNPDGRIKVELPTGSSGLTDTELRASSVPVEQVSGSNWSVYATNPVDNGDAATALRVVIAGNSASSTNASIVSPVAQGDAASAVRVVIAGNSDASVAASQVGTWTISDITASLKAALVDSSGVQYSGSNPVPTTIVSGALTSTIVVGDTLHDAADIGAAPVKIGGVAMQTNPTAVADGDRVNFRADDIGRQLTRPVQVRDLTITAYTSITNGTETSLLAGSSGAFHDLIYVMGANTSDGAVTVDLRASTSGTVLLTIQLPANGTAGIACPVPLPAAFAEQAWTVDMPDYTGTTVYITALFSREI